MSRFKVDLHMHSCLSPCADDDMTPVTMAGMAALNELQIVALTDHNTCGNCDTFYKACEAYGVIPVAGMELTTAEDVHMVCLFSNLEDAVAFETSVYPYRLQLKNKPLVFGNQWKMDTEDEIIGEDPYFLPAATSINISDACELVKSHNGVCYPAHIDREANGLLAMLGSFPPDLTFSVAEVREAKNEALAEGRPIVASSDAHHLLDIGSNDFYLDLDVKEDSCDEIRKELFAFLRGERKGDRV